MGPLKGLKIVEFGAIGPGPFAAQMLGDMGAEIIRIDRKDILKAKAEPKYNTWFRSRRIIALELSKPEGKEAAWKLIEQADAIIEGFRPGVMERLGFGPDECMARNPKLVYGRISGWGQHGPLANTAGHDINYFSLTGGLRAIGRPGQRPAPPLNIVADLGGGGMFLAYGILCAVYERQVSGQGQVVDAAMVDGVATLLGLFYGWLSAGTLYEKRGLNALDGGAPFYDTYETSDGKYIALGAIEPQFYKLFQKLAEIDDPEFDDQMNRDLWPSLKDKVIAVFKTKTRDEWCRIFNGTDACVTPVLTFSEAINHPHNVERKTFIEIDGVKQPAPAPRFSRTEPEVVWPAHEPGVYTDDVLKDWGFNRREIKTLKDKGVLHDKSIS